jgi:hypothetical protein
MQRMTIGLLLALSGTLQAQRVAELEPHNVALSRMMYRGRSAVRVLADSGAANGSSYAVVRGATFHNGTLELQVAGRPAAGASAGARGFIGIAFRLQDGRYEYVYLRPTNGRAEDQVRRNHSTQYGSHPEYDFARLRAESPEKYESYVDLEPGKWTDFRLVVEGTTARLYVHGAEQPSLVISDMKRGDSEGGVALWVGPETEGYFRKLKIGR